MGPAKAMFGKRGAVVVALTMSLTVLTACGVVYNSPKVSRSTGTGLDVREIKVTPETVLLANRSPYSPRNLPREFYSAASATQSTGLGALPVGPDSPERRPQRLELRPPQDVVRRPYHIGVGDVVLLATKSSSTSIEQLSGLLAAQQQRQGYVVSDDGAISIPDIGRVEISGLTLAEAQDRIFRFLLDNQVDPSFSIEVSEFNSQRVTVGGAVKQAARVPITLVPLKLGDALTATGGVEVPDAEFASIRIYREGTLYQIPYEDYLARPDLRELTLQNSDAVFVDINYDIDRAFNFYRQEVDVIRLRNQARTDALTMMSTEMSMRRALLDERRSNFRAREEMGAEKRDYVYLAGEFAKQNRVALPYAHQAVVADVLFAEGGVPNMTGDPANIYVLRPSQDPAEFGAVTAWHIDMRSAANMTLATQMQLRPNDIVFVEQQPITRWNRVVQQFVPTLLTTPASIAAR